MCALARTHARLLVTQLYKFAPSISKSSQRETLSNKQFMELNFFHPRTMSFEHLNQKKSVSVRRIIRYHWILYKFGFHQFLVLGIRWNSASKRQIILFREIFPQRLTELLLTIVTNICINCMRRRALLFIIDKPACKTKQIWKSKGLRRDTFLYRVVYKELDITKQRARIRLERPIIEDREYHYISCSPLVWKAQFCK